MGGKIGTAARVALALTMFGASIAFAIAAERRSVAPASAPVDTIEARGHPSVRVTGHAHGLFPGKVGTLHVTLRNESPYPIWVVRVSARVEDAGPGCSGSVLRVSPRRAHLRIRPHGRIRTVLRVRMLPTSPDACQGARFPISFRARTRIG
jgi:hypothetical protein